MKTRLSKVSVSINMESYKNALTCELTVSKRDENRCVVLCYTTRRRASVQGSRQIYDGHVLDMLIIQNR